MSDGRAVRVLVADDHTLFRRGLTALLASDSRVAVVAEAADAGEAIRHAATTRPDVILLDNHMPGVAGVDAIAGLLEAAPAARVVMLTVSEDEQDLGAALRAGASGYLLKTVDSEGLVDALLRVMRGQAAISPELTGKLVSAFRAAPATAAGEPPPVERLSPREREILAQIARGASNKEIARTLDIAETTVKIHVQHILRKLDLASRVQAAVWAAQHGL